MIAMRCPGSQQDDHDMSCQTFWHACQSNYQWDLICNATKYEINTIQSHKLYLPTTTNENSLIVEKIPIPFGIPVLYIMVQN